MSAIRGGSFRCGRSLDQGKLMPKKIIGSFGGSIPRPAGKRADAVSDRTDD